MGAACKGTSHLIGDSVGVTHSSSLQAHGDVGTCDLWARTPLSPWSTRVPRTSPQGTQLAGTPSLAHIRHANVETGFLGGSGECALIRFLDHVSWPQPLVKKRN